MALRWNIDPVLFAVGPIKIRWYGLCFLAGVLLGVRSLARSFERRGLPAAHASALMLWLPIGLIIGAHLIHLIFYEPRSFIDNPVRIIQLGLGLASHGGGLGAVTALYIFCRRHKVAFHPYVDAVIVGSVWVIPFVRIGNFFNSEIYGRATDLPWGVVFARRGLSEARHPSQLYEATLGFGLVGMTAWLDRRFRDRLPVGALFYISLLVYFVTRFLVEYVKEYQAVARSFPLTMGQMLSAPVVLFCAYMLFSGRLAPPSVAAEPASPPKTKRPIRKKRRKRR